MERLKIYKLYPDVQIPRHQTKQSACFDVSFYVAPGLTVKGYTAMNKPFERYAAPDGSFTISPGDRVMVPTGMILDIPEGYSVRVHARSGLSLKQGLVLANAEGVIDSDYIDELMILVHNISANSIEIRTGDRIAQAELIKDCEYSIEETVARPGIKTDRVGGMGSTGVTSTGDTITITVAKPKLPKGLILEDKEEVKRGRGRPKKNAGSA